MSKKNSWKYKNTTLLIIFVGLFFYFYKQGFLDYFIKFLGNFGYASCFFVGIFFVSIFTAAPSLAILYELSSTLNPFLVALISGVGAMVGDYLILFLLRDKIFEEIKPFFKNKFLIEIFRSPYFSWILPIIGAAIIASPFPDEIGIGFMGLSKVKKWQFLGITFLLNSLGIYFVITLTSIF